jgi:glutamine synthetase
MAGLDGIENRLHPGDAMDKDLYDLPKQELVNIPTVAGSLREALESLESDHAFLLKGDVMNKDFIDSYAELKWQEVEAFEQTTHPLEFEMYYSR